MKRRRFLAASCVAGLAPLAAAPRVHAADSSASEPLEKDLYELQIVKLQPGEKAVRFRKFVGEALIPALNRAGVSPVGAFEVAEGDNPDLFLLLPHRSMDSVVRTNRRILEDEAFLRTGGEVLDAPKDDPAFDRIESSLMLAFDYIPRLEIPTKAASRVLQLRVYESHTLHKAVKKVEMFNEGGEIDIFRRVGLHPVFFGETLMGPKMPNLTYLLSFENAEAMKTAWAAFLADPAWTKLKNDEQYKDTVSNIVNIVLRPIAGSQV